MRFTPKGERTRLRLVRAAADLMSEHGVAGTTVEDVRAAAGVSNSQIYHYFTDKAALVRAVIAFHDETIVGGQQPLFDQFDTLEGLVAWRNAMVAHQQALNCRGGCPIGSLGSELAEVDDAARQQVAASMDRWGDGIHRGLRAMAGAGRLSPEADPEALALGLLAALQGGLLLTQLGRDSRPLEVALDLTVAHIQRFYRSL